MVQRKPRWQRFHRIPRRARPILLGVIPMRTTIT
jgi:hypothetical protein